MSSIRDEANTLLDNYIIEFGKDNKYLLADLEKQIAKLYSKYAKDNKLTYQEALKYLTDNERAEFQHDLKFYLEKIRDVEYLKEHRSELQALSVRARVKRLELLKAEIIKATETLHNNLKQGSTQVFNDVYKVSKETTLKSLPNIDTSDLSSWGKADINRVKTCLEFPFKGENYSEKIWGSCIDFEKQLNITLTNGLVTGKPYNEIVSELQRRYDVKRSNIERLVVTEGNFISNQASLNTYKDNGVKYYKFVARLDQRTSPQCRELNGKVFEVSEAIAGENLPPLHPWCRSTTVPVFDKDRENNSNSDNKPKRNFEPIKGINGKAPKLDKKGEKGYNKKWNKKSKNNKEEILDTFNGEYPNGVVVKGMSSHALSQNKNKEDRQFSKATILDTLYNGKKDGRIKVDKNGERSYKVRGKKCVLVINPDTGIIITVHPPSKWNKKK